MAVRLKDVADRAGVSVSAVSNILSGYSKSRIKPETQERVRQVALEMGYRPSAVARALVRRQTDTLGVVLPPTSQAPLRDPFFSAVLEGVLQAATTRGRDTMVFTAHPTSSTQERLGKLCDGRCDGLIVLYQPSENDILTELLNLSVPFVLTSDWREDPRLFCVDVEHHESMRAMTEYLIGLGHRRLALLSSNIGYYVGPRIAGYQEALTRQGIPADPRFLISDLIPWDPSTVLRAVAALMMLPIDQRPTALLCTNDSLAAIVISALSRVGLRVPEDISVTGFNDDSSAVRQHPSLTTIAQPYETIGGCAIDLVQTQLDDPATPPQRLRLPTKLVIRESTAPAK
ncbi:LacI family transcriptional regulator [Capsulimonas corticalis]|uniref:LacI family transcriptional regulator n=1 Tax=Capsulimonas corticalis TaxID=2219043 RepID=A0A402CRB8_9BACT|nr:LacI family DNA-binding transcriptional regulator [Capsulimonas corticalis]BDI27963.1 LacI family transcriptional regulator [Capsulimonas corticalis]